MPAEWSLRAVRLAQLESYPTLRGLIGQLRSCAMCFGREKTSHIVSPTIIKYTGRELLKEKNMRKMNKWQILTPTCFWRCVEKCLRVWVFGLYTYSWFPITSLSTCVSWTSYLPLRTLIFSSIDIVSYSVIVVKKWVSQCKALNIIHSYRISVLLLLLEA